MNQKPDPLDNFGRFVMQNLRDRALQHVDGLAQGQWRAPGLQSLQAELAKLDDDERNVVRRCVRAAIDSAVHDFLFALQEHGDGDGSIQVLVYDQNVASLSDGLHGEPYSEDGWQARFSEFGQAPETA